MRRVTPGAAGSTGPARRAGRAVPATAAVGVRSADRRRAVGRLVATVLLARLTAALLVTLLRASLLTLLALLPLRRLGTTLLGTALIPADLWVGSLGVVLVLR